MILIALVFEPAAAVLAATAPASSQNLLDKQIRTSKPHPPPYLCGLHCLYAATVLHGKQVEFSSMVDPTYVTYKGSSAVQLEKAAAEWGLHTATVRGLTWNVLRESAYPCLLHVKKSSVGAEKYDHWILLLSVEGDQCKVFDPPNRVAWMPISDLEGRWDRTGVLVADEPVGMSRFLWPARMRFAGWVVGGLAIVGLGYWLRHHRRGRKPARLENPAQTSKASVLQCAVIVLVGGGVGLLHDAFSPGGLLVYSESCLAVQRGHLSSLVPNLEADEVKRLIGRDEAIFVDARYAGDFERGHLPKAVNIPVSTALQTIPTRMQNVPRDARIIVYCQSSGCSFAEKVGAHLMDNGFVNIALYPGGWSEWEALQQK